ncbi:Ctr copper transporter family-domain-containing protein [Amylocarpus encephaloides]|uniref:Copper transport protein n=1 Tax=Amylocarpus encephaloides TaxID=45428 RepID=A0A9P8CA62_9HELO|nr:Ctr copper transporter family-domain-containing protein [Amylocarpus encephaloides]
MSSMTMDMSAASASSTSIPTAATMAMSMGGGSECKLSMLLNWYTTDACFLSSEFRVGSPFPFFLVCLAVFLLVISLELSRRFQRGFDEYLWERSARYREKKVDAVGEMEEKQLIKGNGGNAAVFEKEKYTTVLLEQLARGALHVIQFAISYCIMLLYMSNNGYIIISILSGALCGFALFTRDMLRPRFKR